MFKCDRGLWEKDGMCVAWADMAGADGGQHVNIKGTTVTTAAHSAETCVTVNGRTECEYSDGGKVPV